MSESNDEFSSPGAANATGLQWGNYVGRLLLFHVQSVETDITTINGPKDAVKAYVEVLDGPTAGEGFADTLVWGKVMIPQLSGFVGKKVLGRLGQGNAKPGQNPPWKLEDPTAEDRNIARQHLAPKAPDKPPF